MREMRREKVERALASAEADFRVMLIAALRSCAAGHWGLLDQNGHLDRPRHFVEQAFEAAGAKALFALGQEIGDLRNDLGVAEPFELFARLQELRGRKTANDLGEARLAQAWLKELGV